MSDHYNTQHNHKKAILSEIRSLRYWAFQGHWTFEKYLKERRERILENNHYKKLTRYNRSYISAHMDMLFDDMQKATELRYEDQSGNYRDYKDIMSDVEPNSDDSYNLNMWIANRDNSQPASFWKGTDKIFSPYRKEDWER